MTQPQRRIRVSDTVILPEDSRQVYREKLARITLDSMVQFVGLLDANGTVLEINHVALNAVGVQLSDVEGQFFWNTFWWQVSPQVNQVLRESIEKAAAGDFVRWEAEIYGRANGKETIIIDASLAPVKDSDGKVVFITAEGRDISAKIAQEREIARKNEELQALLLRIRELDEIKTQFFANVSHELRTPLALILGPAERLISDSDGAPAHRQELAHVIRRNARMLLKHVNDLLDISKFEAGKLKIDLQDTDVGALIRLTASHFDVLAQERKINFDITGVVSVTAAIDPQKLQRIVMNLLSNAFKFTPDGGQVRVTLIGKDSDLFVSIEDSGPGVPPELRQAVFERFRQGEGGTNRRYGGTGLGLAIAREFAEMHQGRIEVGESAWKGAAFAMTLPLRRLTAEPPVLMPAIFDRGTLDGLLEELQKPRPSAEALTAVFANSRPRVLVVEDNVDMNRFIAQCLGREFEVVTAFDGTEGVERALEFSPDLIVTDIMMPKSSGAELVAAIRRHPQVSETPIILLSAKADQELQVQLLAKGAQDFITKPFTEDDLLIRARNQLAVRRLRENETSRRSAVEQANRELKAQTLQLNELFHRAPSFMAVLRGPNHVFELANTAYIELVGKRDLIGHSIAEAFPELAGQGYIELLDGVLRTGELFLAHRRPVLLRRTAGGPLEERYLDFIYQPLSAPDGTISGIFVDGHDVTEQKHAEDALLLASKRKDDFLATLSHELRTPLNPALLLASEGAANSSFPESAREDFRTIVEHIGIEARLIDDLLDISRITHDKLPLDRKQLHLHALLQRAFAGVESDVKEKSLAAALRFGTGDPVVTGDEVRLHQIFSNLIRNSVKFTPSGGTVTVATRVLDSKLHRIFVEVTDTGLGLTATELANVFQPFAQGDHSEKGTAAPFGGLGLGLAIARKLTELHGGIITATSDGRGKGATFTVELPLTAEVRVSLPPAASITPLLRAASAEGFRVLLIEDHAASRDALARLLRRRKLVVTTATSAEEALERAQSEKFDFVISDLGLPDMDGYELMTQLRSRYSYEGVALSGHGTESDIRRGQDAGFVIHLTKPVQAHALDEVLGQMARRQHGR